MTANPNPNQLTVDERARAIARAERAGYEVVVLGTWTLAIRGNTVRKLVPITNAKGHTLGGWRQLLAIPATMEGGE